MQYAAPSTDVPLRAFFSESKEGKTGLTVTVNVWGPGGSAVAAAAAAAIDATEQPGVYGYTLDELETATPGIYTAIFHTETGTVDQQDIYVPFVVAQWVADIPDMETDVDQIETLVNTINSNVEQYQAVQETPRFEPIGTADSETLGAGVFTLPINRRADGVLIQVLTQNAYMTLNGDTPSANLGFVITADDPFVYIPVKYGKTTLKFLRASAGAVLRSQFIRSVRS